MVIHPSNMLIKKSNRGSGMIAKMALHTITENGVSQFIRGTTSRNHQRFIPEARSELSRECMEEIPQPMV
jgi:hypothetical protein